jgi:Spy/CpxP family protein refolding chaperone
MNAVELREALELTDEQVTQLQVLTELMFEASKPRARALLDAEARLHQLFAGRRADAASVEARVREIEQLRADLRLVHLRAHLETYGVLTAEQRQR